MVPIAIRHPSEMSAETPQAHRLIRAMPSERSWSSTTAGTYPGKESATRLLILAPFCFPTVPASYLLAAPSSRAPSLTCPDSLVACIVWGQHKPCDQPKIRPLPGHDSQGVRRKRNFLERRYGEVRRIYLLGTGVKIALAAAPFSWFRGDPARDMDHLGE